MHRYVVLGITNYGYTQRLANRRGDNPDETIAQALARTRNFSPGFDKLILIVVHEDHGEIGDGLGVGTFLIAKVPQPTYKLTKI